MANEDFAAWDAHAATFADEPDHGPRDPRVRQAWAALLDEVLPPAPAAVRAGAFDVVLARHLLWAFEQDQRATVVGNWLRMLRGGGPIDDERYLLTFTPAAAASPGPSATP